MKKAPWLIFFLCVTIFLEAQTVSTTINSNRLNQNQQTKTTTTNNYSNQTKSNLETENLSDSLSANQAATVITNRTLAVASADYKVCYNGDIILRSYATIVAAIPATNPDTCFDFSRVVYGYTSTTNQHISKFAKHFNATKVIIRG